MEHPAYLLFELNGSLYGITATAVRELFFIPEITPIAEAPPYISGMIDLRGEILPILDLHRRLEQAPPPYQLTDSIVVLGSITHQLGIVVNHIQEVRSIAPEQITAVSPDPSSHPSPSVIAGFARLDNTIITLLNPDSLLQQAKIFAHEYFNVPQSDAIESTEVQLKTANLFAHLSFEAKQILEERSNHLRQVPALTEESGLMPVAVVKLGEAYLGFGLETVYEFINIQSIAPVPCCPPHIIGNMNLRGEIVTIVDISPVVNSSKSDQQLKKAIVVRVNQIVAGIEVDDILDVIHIRSSDLASTPVAVHSTGDDFLQGVAPYQNKLMSIINLPKMLTSGVLMVNEEV